MIETWKQFRDSQYSVSNAGRVKGPRGIKAQRLGPSGYFKVNICLPKLTTFDVHLMVAECFLGESKGRQTCHGELGKTCNSINNLSYGTKRKNTSVDRNRDHNYKSKHPGVTHNGYSWIAQALVSGKKKYLGSFKSEEQARDAYLEAVGSEL